MVGSGARFTRNGRVEARRAVAPGVPDLEEQERRDRVPAGTYGRLYDSGQLEVAEGLRVQPVQSAMWPLISGDLAPVSLS